jgi:hypothetical protein
VDRIYRPQGDMRNAYKIVVKKRERNNGLRCELTLKCILF